MIATLVLFVLGHLHTTVNKMMVVTVQYWREDKPLVTLWRNYRC